MSEADQQKEEHEESEDEGQQQQMGDEQTEVLVVEDDANFEPHEELLEDGEEEKPPPDDSVARVLAHDKDIFCLALSGDGRWLASGSEDETAAIWNIEQQTTDEPHWRILGKHNESINCLAWNCTSNLLASGDMAGRIICTLVQIQQTDNCLSIEDCQVASSMEEDEVSHEEEQIKPVGKEEAEDSFEQICWLLWHPTAEGILFAGCGDGLLWMWLIAKQRTDQQLIVVQSKIFTSGTNAPCYSGLLTADIKHLVAAYEDSTLRLWDLKEARATELRLPGKCTGAMDLHAKTGTAAIGFSNGTTALVGTGSAFQNQLKLLHLFVSPKNEKTNDSAATGGSEEDSSECENSVECVRFCPGDFPWLAVGTAGGHLSIFDWERRSSRYECDHDGEAVVSCIWRICANNSITLISACIDSAIRVWDAKSGEPLALMSGGGDEIFCLAKWESSGSQSQALANHNSMLFTGCAGGLVRVFQLQPATNNSSSSN